MMADYNLWERPLGEICREAATILVKDIMYTPAGGEYVEEDATIDAAIHQLVVGRHQSLLVIDESRRVVGVLRLTDVFHEIVKTIKASGTEPSGE
jgi:CBS-domain-containing membrane protein